MEMSIRNRFHGSHWPRAQSVVLKAEHLVHDTRFWAIVALAAFLAILVTMAILGIIYGEPGAERTPGPLYTPYGF